MQLNRTKPSPATAGSTIYHTHGLLNLASHINLAGYNKNTETRRNVRTRLWFFASDTAPAPRDDDDDELAKLVRRPSLYVGGPMLSELWRDHQNPRTRSIDAGWLAGSLADCHANITPAVNDECGIDVWTGDSFWSALELSGDGGGDDEGQGRELPTINSTCLDTIIVITGMAHDRQSANWNPLRIWFAPNRISISPPPNGLSEWVLIF